jgi:hypothetical protein
MKVWNANFGFKYMQNYKQTEQCWCKLQVMIRLRIGGWIGGACFYLIDICLSYIKTNFGINDTLRENQKHPKQHDQVFFMHPYNLPFIKLGLWSLLCALSPEIDVLLFLV